MERSRIAKIGHLFRVMKLNIPITGQHLERLGKIVECHIQEHMHNGKEINKEHNSFIKNAFEKVKNGTPMDKLSSEESFWLYEIVEWTKFDIYHPEL